MEQQNTSPNLPINSHIQPPSNNKMLVIVGVILILLVGIGSYFLGIQTSKRIVTKVEPTISRPTEAPTIMSQTDNYIVRLKQNPSDKLKGDVYLINAKTNEEKFYMTIQDLDYYRGSGQYINGNLYVVLRPGGPLAYTTNPNWTDELWKYDQNKKGTKLYSSRGLIYDVSNNEKHIAIFDSSNQNLPSDTLILINQNGEIQKKFITEKTDPSLSFSSLGWDSNIFWGAEVKGQQPIKIMKIDTSSYQTKSYDVEQLNLTVTMHDIAFNPQKGIYIYSDLPFLGEVGIAESWAAAKHTVTLYAYDVEKGTKSIITTSVAKGFQPKWLDATTLEYNDPITGNRVTKQF